MKLEYQVCSLELAKRLKELGVKQESEFQWVNNDPSRTDALAIYVYHNDFIQEHGAESSVVCSAFTVAELLNILLECGLKSILLPLAGKHSEADYLARYLINEKAKI
jgi:hypothetical protein